MRTGGAACPISLNIIRCTGSLGLINSEVDYNKEAHALRSKMYALKGVVVYTVGDSLLLDVKADNVMNMLGGNTDRWVVWSNLPEDHPPRPEFGVKQEWGGGYTKGWLLQGQVYMLLKGGDWLHGGGGGDNTRPLKK